MTTASGWERRYARLLVVGDVATLAVALCISLVVTRGTPDDIASEGILAVTVLAVAILACLSATGSRMPRVVGVGNLEYRALARSTLYVFTVAALLAYGFDLRGYGRLLLYGAVITFLLLTVERWLFRIWLVRRRRAGEMMNRVLLVGSEESIAATAEELARTPEAGLRVVGACTPTGRVADYIEGTDIAISGSVENLIAAVDAVDADTVLITSSNELSSEKVRSVSWQLEPGRKHLIVAPSLTDVGGPRLHTRPVAGLPLVHVETPRYRGGKLYVKRLFDILAAVGLLVVLAPVFAFVAITIAVTSPGGVFFRQERIGLGGEKFYMLKFRSMYADAEERLLELKREADDRGNTVMFKMRNDPRVTPIGRFLRKVSIDELPQLINVLRGEMSLVGPRPPLEREVEQYADRVHRRFLVKPGITGLWQVSGRSNLSWDDTVRLDLFYVENWTIGGDLSILLRTVKAVVARDGAY